MHAWMPPAKRLLACRRAKKSRSMIDISHRQARYLIRQGSDGRRLPDEQWAILQSHIEGCAECRAYRDRLDQAAHEYQRSLHVRWNPVRGPGTWQVQAVLRYREGRKRLRKAGVSVGYVLLGILLLLAYSTYRRISAPPPEPTLRPTVVSSAASPTVPPITFRGVVAYENRQEGSSDIFLLNFSSEADDFSLNNLTSSQPANDTNPTWSPDGDWLAFLSDRSGKPEVYVIHVAGSRITQLTDEPGVNWQGPLTWSRDGLLLALVGQRSDSGANWVYLVPLDGSGPRSIGLTHGASGALQFSPSISCTGLWNFRPAWRWFDGIPHGFIFIYHADARRYY
jgi:hypothetical protein